MHNAKAIKKRRKITRNIYKITKTMGLVATAKLKIALRRLSNFQIYKDKFMDILKAVSQAKVSHSLITPHENVKHVTVLAIASNKGLCGSYNLHLADKAFSFYEKVRSEGKEASLEVVGRKTIGYLKSRKIKDSKNYDKFPDQPSFSDVEQISQSFMQNFLQGKTDEVWCVYTYKTRIVQEKILPFSLPVCDEKTKEAFQDYLYSPDPKSLMEDLLPMCIKLKLYQVFLDAVVSEQTSRMLAMKMASENAEKMIQTLTREYNRARQSQITQEITEILGGSRVEK